MKLFSTFLALGFALSVSLAAHADEVDVFALNATMVGGYTTSGTVNIDVTTGVVQGGNIDVYNSNSTLADVLSTVATQGLDGAGTYSVLFSSPSATGQDYYYDLWFQPSSLVGYTGGSLTPFSTYFYTPTDGNSWGAFSATLTDLTPPVDPTPDATAPEPSSLALLGTGLLGAAGVARRRMLSA
jgi:hypothetical protein